MVSDVGAFQTGVLCTAVASQPNMTALFFVFFFLSPPVCIWAESCIFTGMQLVIKNDDIYIFRSGQILA